MFHGDSFKTYNDQKPWHRNMVVKICHSSILSTSFKLAVLKFLELHLKMEETEEYKFRKARVHLEKFKCGCDIFILIL